MGLSPQFVRAWKQPWHRTQRKTAAVIGRAGFINQCSGVLRSRRCFLVGWLGSITRNIVLCSKHSNAKQTSAASARTAASHTWPLRGISERSRRRAVLSLEMTTPYTVEGLYISVPLLRKGTGKILFIDMVIGSFEEFNPARVIFHIFKSFSRM